MNSFLTPIFLGIDFGTTKVKATVMNSNEAILGTYTISWNEAGCNKLYLSDWLKIFKNVVQNVFIQSKVDSRLVSSIAITAISPCLALIDRQSENPTSPIILYDEVITLGKKVSRIGRINSAIRILNGFTPNISNKKNYILTANAWLVWQLTGEIAIDNYSLHDVLGVSKKQSVKGAKFPENIVAPSSIVGTIKKSWAEILDIPANVKICCGSTDTVGLVRATRLSVNDHLIYLGTFFTVLQAKENFYNRIPAKFTQLPYQWHISLEGGALIERLASAYFPMEENRSIQIHKFLEVVRKSMSIDEEQVSKIIAKKWSLGMPVQMLPELSIAGNKESALANLAMIPFVNFTQALRTYFSKAEEVGTVHVVGGLSTIDWITEYISKNANIACSSKINVFGAEGAALLAKDGMNGG